jgi:hypothetical protein
LLYKIFIFAKLKYKLKEVFFKMSLKGLVRQELFVLTRDMVPIHFTGFQEHGATFVCPLPKGFREIIKENSELIRPRMSIIVAEINKKALNQENPFQNILLGYQERTAEDQKRLLQGFQITRIYWDERGVYGVWAGGNVNSGDIYLDSNTSHYYEYMTLDPLEELFEPGVAFHCHNVDWYWQALLTREFCVEYFNLLNRLIFQK